MEGQFGPRDLVTAGSALVADPADPSKLDLGVGGTAGNDVIKVFLSGPNGLLRVLFNNVPQGTSSRPAG